MENKLEKIGQNNFMDNFVKTDDILKDMCGIIESSQKAAYRAVNTTLIQRNWLLGYRIASEELQGEDRAKYGAEIIKKLAKELSAEYGKGYTKSNLYSFYSFYKTYPEIFQTPSGKSVGLLSWSHYAALLQVKDEEARDWYEKEAVEQTWSVRTLQRNISSQYYYRMLGTQKKELVESEMKELTAPYQNDKLEFIKNPVVAEFLGFSQNTDFTESDLEKSILSNLQKFLMELGKGYAFVARQQHIHTEKQDYYIDLVTAYANKFSNRVIQSIDIEHFITEFLMLRIEYASFAEDDAGRIGFLADGATPLLVHQDGKIIPFVFPKDTIVLDKFLLAEKEQGRRRFTMAHEASHHILSKMYAMPSEGRFHAEYDSERSYSKEELAQMFASVEWQADTMGASLLMPRRIIENALAKYNQSNPIKVYGDNTITSKDKAVIRRMAAYIGVSYTALVIRLRDMGLFEYHNILEYISNELNLGGVSQ